MFKQIEKSNSSIQFPNEPSRYVHNLSSLPIDDTLMEILSLGPKFCCPKKNTDRLKLEVQFESLYSQLTDLTPTSALDGDRLKSTLINTCYQYLQHDQKTRLLVRPEHLRALKNLQKNDSILLSKPDKGAGIVILNKEDYLSKMLEILKDATKFELKPKENDKTPAIEKAISKQLKDLKLRGIIDSSTFERLKPMGSTIPRLYGLPKVHKLGVPLRPILDMCNSPYHAMAKWLARLIEPIRSEIAKYTVADTFEFVDTTSNLNLEGYRMTSFDVSSLFTNVPLKETVEYICDYIQQKKIKLALPTEDLRRLLLLCSQNIQFRFNNKVYRQKDGVAMGSPLGPIFADIFMAKLENNELRPTIDQFKFYKRYVDDIFCLLRNDTMTDPVLNAFNIAHKNIKFTVETECDNYFHFLDVKLTRRLDGTIQRSIYRKPTWTGQYVHYRSFVPHRMKINLIRCLLDRAERICSADTFDDEVGQIRQIFLNNGYPDKLIAKCIRDPRRTTQIMTAERKKVFLALPFKGDQVANRTVHRLSTELSKSYYAAQLRVHFFSVPIVRLNLKDKLPSSSTSFCVYKFNCVCEASYIGRTARRLSDRIKEHCPSWFGKGLTKSINSSVLSHLVDSNHRVDSHSAFEPIYRVSGRLPQMTKHRLLAIAEAIGIRLHTPSLCLQKNYVRPLMLFPTHTHTNTLARSNQYQ